MLRPDNSMASSALIDDRAILRRARDGENHCSSLRVFISGHVSGKLGFIDVFFFRPNTNWMDD